MFRLLICTCLLLAAVVNSFPKNEAPIRERRSAAAAETEITFHQRSSADATAEEIYEEGVGGDPILRSLCTDSPFLRSMDTDCQPWPDK